jgi:hypothetical protein
MKIKSIDGNFDSEPAWCNTGERRVDKPEAVMTLLRATPMSV